MSAGIARARVACHTQVEGEAGVCEQQRPPEAAQQAPGAARGFNARVALPKRDRHAPGDPPRAARDAHRRRRRLRRRSVRPVAASSAAERQRTLRSDSSAPGGHGAAAPGACHAAAAGARCDQRRRTRKHAAGPRKHPARKQHRKLSRVLRSRQHSKDRSHARKTTQHGDGACAASGR